MNSPDWTGNRPLELILAELCAIGLLAVLWAIFDPHSAREAQHCRRWYSAASSTRDSLWIATLRPECTR